MPRIEHDIGLVVDIDAAGYCLEQQKTYHAEASHGDHHEGDREPRRKREAHSLFLVFEIQYVAHAAHRVDQFHVVAVVDLRTQPPDGNFHHIGIAVEIHIPHIGGDLGTAQHFAAPACEQLQQREFARSEFDTLTTAA